jgi:hypothetical protein
LQFICTCCKYQRPHLYRQISGIYREPLQHETRSVADEKQREAQGEHPVVYHMPFRNTPFQELGASYGAWLTENLSIMVEVWSDGA